MLKAQADTNATKTTESKPELWTKKQGRANTAATASVLGGMPNGKRANRAKAQAAESPAPAKGPKKRRKKGASGAKTKGGRKRGRKPYPVVALADVLPLAEGIMTHNAGQPVVRETLLKKMGLDAGAQSTRNLITNSNKYGATEGGYTAPNLRLTAKGLLAVDPRANPIDKKKARFALAIGDVTEFNAVFEKRKGNNMPAPEMLHDDLASLDAGDRYGDDGNHVSFDERRWHPNRHRHRRRGLRQGMFRYQHH